MRLSRYNHINGSHHFESGDAIMKHNGQHRVQIFHCYISLTMEIVNHGIHLWYIFQTLTHSIFENLYLKQWYLKF